MKEAMKAAGWLMLLGALVALAGKLIGKVQDEVGGLIG